MQIPVDMANDNIFPPFVNPLGRPLNYEPQELIDKFREYVQWAKENPIVLTTTESGVSGSNTFAKDQDKIIPRRLSLGGFQVFIGCSDSWWVNIGKGKRGEEFLRVKEAIKKYCEEYQVEMASAGVFNANIISRLLGLADKQEVDHKGDIVTRIVRSEEEKKALENIGNIGV